MGGIGIHKFNCIFFSLFLLTYGSLLAVNKPHRFYNLNVEDGLSQSWVMSIEQDSLGFMWFATRNGLNKFNGYDFTVYKHSKNNKNSIISNHIQDLAIDESGDIWLGTNVGLCKYNYISDEFITEIEFAHKSVNALTIFDNTIYAGTVDGIFIYDIKRKTNKERISVAINNQLKNVRINAINHDNAGNIWIGTSEGLYVYSNKYKQLYADSLVQTTMALSNKFIRAIEIDSLGNAWIGTGGFGIYYLPLVNNFFSLDRRNYKNDVNNPNSLNQGRIHALHINKGKLLIGIENGGVDILDLSMKDSPDPVFLHQVNDPGNINSISNNSVYSIYQDKRGDIWIGTYGGGVNYFNNKGDNFQVITHVHNEKNSLVNKITNVINKKGDELWVGTEGGISIINLKKHSYKHLTHNPLYSSTISSNAVWSMFFDKNKHAWIGMWAGGLNKLNDEGKVIKRFKYKEFSVNSTGSGNVFGIDSDHENNLWIGTMHGGLNKYIVAEDKMIQYDLKSEEVNNSLIDEVNHVFCNSNKELWFSTSICVGYVNVETNTTHYFYQNENDPNSFKSSFAYEIFEDSKNNMWFGSDNGLIFFNREMSNFKLYSSDEGLPNIVVKSIEEDDEGNFWMGTSSGLIKFYDAVNLPKNIVFKKYDFSDGLIGNEFNRRASFKDENGVMYFGGPNGITYFNPKELHENTNIPRAVITDFHIANRHVSINDENSPITKHISLIKEITLEPDWDVFSIEYAALSYLASNKNQYAYYLEGFDNEWNYVKNKRIATYTNLNAGTYLFKVKACNNDGYWNEKPTTLKITILPPWYKTGWALTLYIVLVLTAIYLYLFLSQKRFKRNEALKLERLQHEQESELNQQRLQFFTNISHEFRTPLTLIYSPIENILKNYYRKLPNEVKGQLSTIYKNALRLNRLATELMDFRKLQFNKLNMSISQQDICAFTQNVANLFNEEADLNRINFTCKIPENPVFMWFDQSMIEKVLFNLLSNAFKVTLQNGSINIELSADEKNDQLERLENEKWLCIKVADTGTGLTKDQISKIFERFYQADNYSKTYYSSTGIGLSLAKGLIEMHGGKITVDSEPNLGSEFKVWLRTGNSHFTAEELKKAPKEIIEPDPNPLPEIEEELGTVLEPDLNITVLVVEDNRELRDYLVKELKKYYKVVEARNGAIGIELAEKHLPDVIVSDVLMPETDGLELCRTIKGNERISHIPIILLTARAAVEDQIEGTEAGADAYIVKPFNPDLLKSRINQLLSSRKKLFAKFSTDLKILPQIDSFTNFDKTFLQQVTDYIIQNISNPELSVEELGEQMHLSRSQLYRKIKSLTGHTATEFMRIIRLEQARKMITVNKLPINEVGYKVGFGTPSYFTKCYKEHFGKLPSEE